MSGIRVTYSGLIGFLVSLVSVITGIIFTIIITRTLDPEEFAIWAIIGSMLAYFMIVAPIISYWSTRQLARGEPVGKTSMFSSTIFSLLLIPIYVVLAFFVSSVASEYLHLLILGAVLLPVIFVNQTLVGINLAHKPHAISYGIFVFELIKVPVGLSLVYFLDLGVTGAILATLIAHIIQLLVQLYFARSKLKDKFNIRILFRWIKLSWLPLYNYIGSLIWSLDIMLFTIITGSLVGVAYYAASLAIASVVAHSGMISQAIYPKLLAKGKSEFLQGNLTHLLYFAIPLLGLTIVFAESSLFILNPEYIIASTVVILLAFRTFFYAMYGTLHKILLGIETVDVEENPTFSRLIKSKLMQVPTIITAHSGLYIGILVFVLYFADLTDLSELDLVVIWSAISVAIQIPFFIYSLFLVRKNVKLSVSFVDISKYILGTLGFVFIFLVTSESFIKFEISIFDYLPGFLIQMIICILFYLGFTYVIDRKTRILFKSVISELMLKIK